MQGREMGSMQGTGSDYSTNNTSSGISWSSETNWVVAHGSVEDSITIESSDHPIDESKLENAARKSPLVLKPTGLDSGPCEIKICFQQKYEVCQIYIRSTARVYEVYYARSPQSSNEYLCTVRCGVAERDEKLLQTDYFQDVVEGNGGNSSPSEDDWVKIKVPEAGKSSASDDINTNVVKKVQDFYEATAQMSDVDPCSLLTIRLLSLQDKGHVYVDEVYIFVDPTESTDSGSEAVLAGSSAQSSLMAMFVPTLLHLSKSRQVQDSDKVLQNDKTENGLGKINEIETNQVHQQYVKPKELDKDEDKPESAKQPELVQSINLNEYPHRTLETSLEQLISRVTRIEDICLRFEEKLLKPIESIEARLEKVEHQLEKLSKKSHYSISPRGTRISAPSFSCSESNSSSFHSEQSEKGPEELGKKDLSCQEFPSSSHDADFHPSFVVTAPECPYSEDKEENEDLKPLKDSPNVIPKKTLSVDDALAAALNGFLSTAVIHPSEQIQTKSDLSCKEDEENEAQEFPEAENGDTESSRYSQVLTIKAPDFTAEEIDDEEHLNNNNNSTHSSLNMGPGPESKEIDKDNCDETGSSDFYENGSGPESNGHLTGNSEVKMIDSYFEGEMISSNTDNGEIVSTQFSGDEPETESKEEERYGTVERCLKDNTAFVSDPSRLSLLDFEFPILEVKFSSNEHDNTKSPLEALLDGEAESNAEDTLIPHDDDGCNNKEVNDTVMDGNEKTNLLQINHLLVDIGVSDAGESSILDGASHDLVTPSSLETNASLI